MLAWRPLTVAIGFAAGLALVQARRATPHPAPPPRHDRRRSRHRSHHRRGRRAAGGDTARLRRRTAPDPEAERGPGVWVWADEDRVPASGSRSPAGCARRAVCSIRACRRCRGRAVRAVGAPGSSTSATTRLAAPRVAVGGRETQASAGAQSTAREATGPGRAALRGIVIGDRGRRPAGARGPLARGRHLPRAVGERAAPRRRRRAGVRPAAPA